MLQKITWYRRWGGDKDIMGGQETKSPPPMLHHLSPQGIGQVLQACSQGSEGTFPAVHKVFAGASSSVYSQPQLFEFTTILLRTPLPYPNIFHISILRVVASLVCHGRNNWSFRTGFSAIEE
jgi:hypothetical protein